MACALSLFGIQEGIKSGPVGALFEDSRDAHSGLAAPTVA